MTTTPCAIRRLELLLARTPDMECADDLRVVLADAVLSRRLLDAARAQAKVLQSRVDAGVAEAIRLASILPGSSGMHLNAAAPVPAQPAAESTCAWSENDDGFYETECGNSFQFIDGGAADNNATFCQYCGKKIGEHWFDDMPEGDAK